MLLKRLVIVFGVFALTACNFEFDSEGDAARGYQLPVRLDPLRVKPSEALSIHTSEFDREVIRVGERVYVAVGYALANSILIVGDGGNIIVDTTGTVETARAVRAEFDRISSQPLRAIIYTHNHGDHVFGAGGMAGNDRPKVYAHVSTAGLVGRVTGMLNPIISRRSHRMFGNSLQGSAYENAGIGPSLEIRPDRALQFLPPTDTVDDSLQLEIAGVRLELVHARGETDDQLFVYLPDDQTLLPGDNFYRAFPNLYTIRGTPWRDLQAWVSSIDQMRARNVQHLVPAHTRPLSDSELITQQLTQYRDAIQYVHDEALRRINRGAMPDQLHQLKLPESLSSSPWLQPFYGKPGWSARSVFSGYLGWFSGNPTDLQPLPPASLADRLLDLGGGYEAMLSAARDAWVREDYQWLLHLTDVLLQAQANNEEARLLRHNALVRLGERESNPNARHYYLTSAQQLYQQAGNVLPAVADNLERMPLPGLLQLLRLALDPQRAVGKNISVHIYVTDTRKSYSLTVRHSVLEVLEGKTAANADVALSGSATGIKSVLSGQRNPIVALSRNDISVQSGSRLQLLEFLGLFNRSP